MRRQWPAILILTLAGSALAADDKGELLREAGAKERAGDRAAALGLLERAYAASGDPLIQYDIGRVRQSLGRLAEAMEAFERFTAEAARAPKIYRQDAERRSAELRRRVRFLEIRADAGARVTIDDRAVGETPLPRAIAIDPGPHRVRLEKPGYEPLDREVAASDTVVEASLRARRAEPPPEPAAINVVAPPPPELMVSEQPEPAAAPTTVVTVAAGGTFWSPTPAVDGPAPSVAVGASHRVWSLGSETALSVGGVLGASWLRATDTNLLLSLLATSLVRRSFGERWHASASLGLGPMLMTGVQPRSPLLTPGAVTKVKSPGLFGFEARAGLGAEYDLSPRLALLLAPQLVVDPRPSRYFAAAALVRLETTLGLALRL